MNIDVRVTLAFLSVSLCASAGAQSGTGDLKFNFVGGTPKPGYIEVAPSDAFAEGPGYGYEAVEAGDGANAADKPLLFSVKVPEGNYDVAVTLGGASTVTTSTLKVEAGRLMVERNEVPAGQTVTYRFTTNVRTPTLPSPPENAPGRGEVSLDKFDRGNARDWDNKLSLEIAGPHAPLRSVEIVPAPSAPTVFLAGDSTVTDRDGGGDVSWGQLLPRFFKPGVAIANDAQSGETLKSFANALRLDKILSQMKKGDYLFIQFGHNDSKADWPQTFADAETTYKAYLRVYIAEARLRGATPVLVTPMDRANRTTGAPSHGHGAYPEAMREVAREEHVALIDLYAMSIALYEAAGADAPKILADGTHSTAFGGYEFAKCIAMGIKQNRLDLARFLRDDSHDFDPKHPDSPTTLHLDGLFRDVQTSGAMAPAGKAFN